VSILGFIREEHVGGAHPYKKNKNKCFLGVDNNPIITYKNIYNLTMKGIQL